MKPRLAILISAAALACSPVFAKGGGGRANYGGGKHSSSHGGHLSGLRQGADTTGPRAV